MTPSNRRIGKPQLPPDVLAEDGYEGSPLHGEDDEARVVPEAPPPAPPSGKLVRAMAVLRTVLGAVLVIGVAVSISWGARRYVRESPRFALRNVTVAGLQHRTEAEIIERAGLVVGQNLFAVELDEVRGRLAADPWLKDVALSRRLPGTIAVEVTERQAAAMVIVGETSYLATREGEIFKRLEAGDPVDFPVISGMTAEAIAEDRENAFAEVKRALDLAAEYAESPLGAKAPLEQVHVADHGALTLVIGKGGLSLSLGKPPFRRRLEQAARVVNELERRLGPKALTEKTDGILLDNEARPERVVVRMR